MPSTGQSGLTTVLFYNRAFSANNHAAAVALSIFMLVLLVTALSRHHPKLTELSAPGDKVLELERFGLRRRSVMIGKRGRVIGRIAPGIVGEVMLPVRGATEAFYAYPATDEVIEVGTPIVVVEFDPPRTVYVSRAF